MQLFNIHKDPREKVPLKDADTTFGKLKYDLSQHIREAGSVPWQKIDNGFHTILIKNLE